MERSALYMPVRMGSCPGCPERSAAVPEWPKCGEALAVAAATTTMKSANRNATEGDAVRLGEQLLRRGRAPARARLRLAADRDRTPLGKRHHVRGWVLGPGLGGLLGALEAAGAQRRLVYEGLLLPRRQDCLAVGVHIVVILPQGAGAGWIHRISFLSPAGLADGLALKESRYTSSVTRPRPS